MRWLLFLFLLLAPAAFAAGQARKVTVFLAGDSTMAPKQADRRPETGWGEMLQKYFKKGKVVVDNRALNGRSTVSFISEGCWQAIVDAMKKGDFVFIEFGHNDQKMDKPGVYASPDVYKANLLKFISEVRAKEANPVLMTPVSRRKFENGVLVKTHGEYPGLVKMVAEAERVPVIDMEMKSAAVLSRYGVEGSTKLFLQLKPGENSNYPKGVEDNTHFSPLGADEMANLAVEGIRETKVKLSKYLKTR